MPAGPTPSYSTLAQQKQRDPSPGPGLLPWAFLHGHHPSLPLGSHRVSAVVSSTPVWLSHHNPEQQAKLWTEIRKQEAGLWVSSGAWNLRAWYSRRGPEFPSFCLFLLNTVKYLLSLGYGKGLWSVWGRWAGNQRWRMQAPRCHRTGTAISSEWSLLGLNFLIWQTVTVICPWQLFAMVKKIKWRKNSSKCFTNKGLQRHFSNIHTNHLVILLK